MASRARPEHLFLAFALALVASEASAAGRFFCCNDDQGRQVCGDILPPVCVGRAYREIGEGGTTARRVEAPLTAEQRARRDAEEKRHREEEAALRDQRRRDQALLDTYSSERDIEMLRTRAENEVRQSIRDAETKIEEARLRRQKYENEAEFYRKKALPAEVEMGLRDADLEISAFLSIIESKKRELATIREKYDEDLRRYREVSRRLPAR